MKDIFAFFQQYESAIYFILLSGMIIYGVRFYRAWQELRGSVFGLEQISAQRRLNRSALAIFFMLMMGIGVFSLIAFVVPVVDANTAAEIIGLEEGIPLLDNADGTEVGSDAANVDSELATATPLPTVEVVLGQCDEERINITSPLVDQEVSGVIEITGVINVEDFGFYVIEYAELYSALWNPIFSSRVLVPEESTLLEWDTTTSPSGNYIIQLVVTDNDMEEYPICQIPIRISN